MYLTSKTSRLWELAVSTLLGLVLAMSLSLLAASLDGARAEQAVATGARVGGDTDRTRFVADLSTPVSFTVYVMPDPYRVMIDLPDVAFDLPPDSGNKALGLISAFRYGEIEAGRSRIVLEAAGPVLIEKSFIVEPQAGQPARIVVDLVKTTKDGFAKAYKADEGRSAKAVARAGAEDGTDQPQPDDVADSALSLSDLAAADETDALADAPSSPSAGKKLRPGGRRLVVIDPGHGGIDPGAIGLRKTKEKDVVLAFGQTLRDILVQSGNYDVVMTRDDDSFLSLKKRVRIAREHEADLFIAIHADTVRGPTARGATIYTLSERASDAEAEQLAHKENRADIIAGIDLGDENEAVTDILIDLAQRESKMHSMFFARKAVAEMKTVTRFTGKPLRSAGFVVLKAPDVPSVLIELGYLSSRQDEAQLTSPDWQKRVAGAMARAVDRYFELQVAARAQ
jgi:N-acetylmuramoyl-L-alanine amidase